MKTTTKNFTRACITGILFLVMGFIGNTSLYAQFTGLSIASDSAINNNTCINEVVTRYIGWSNTGVYGPGDVVDIDIDWGDGNIDNYSIPILYSPGYGYIYSFAPTHVYTTTGSYMITANSLDSYGAADSESYPDPVVVSNLCGDVSGTVFLDEGSGTFDAGDVGIFGIPMLLSSSGPAYNTTTSTYGVYNINNFDDSFLPYTLQVDPAWLASTGLTVIDPPSGFYTVTTVDSYFPFLLNCGASTYTDLSIWAYGWGFRAGLNTGYVRMIINNISCTGAAVNTDISLDFDALLTYDSSNLPGGVVTGNTISWTGASIPPGNTYVDVFFSVPGATPAGTPLNFQADIAAPSITEGTLTNNSFIFASEVRNSWDPNDKNANLPRYIDADIQDELVYTIRFQNMGNDDALNIHIIDTLSSLLDLSTFKVVGQSHEGSYSINPATREVIFTFPNIMLAPQSVSELLSQGFISYKIKENTGNGLNTEINNTAYIYFDFNEPVITNTTSHTNVDNLGIEDVSENPLIIYPQPSTEVMYIGGLGDGMSASLTLYDVSGKMLMQQMNVLSSTAIQVGNLPGGLYLAVVKVGNEVFTKKVCIRH